MAKAKATYTPIKTVRKTVFRNGVEQMTIAQTEGKSGHNVKASVKNMEDKDLKAMTGARASYQDPDQAKEHYDRLVKDAMKLGWSAVPNGRNSFEELPAPAAAAKTGKAHRAGK